MQQAKYVKIIFRRNDWSLRISSSRDIRITFLRALSMMAGSPAGLVPTKHYHVLDCLRGIAAISVVMYHVLLGFGIDSFFGKAYLAVDFFFLLSGFVVARAYDHRLGHGMTVADFALRRFNRLYPMIFLGMTMGILISLAKVIVSHAGLSKIDFVSAVFYAYLMLPFGALGSGGLPFLFPFNSPSWSLFFEIIANVFYGVLKNMLYPPIMSAIIAISAIGMCVLAFKHNNLDLGSLRTAWWGGLPRVGFSFFLGVALYRYGQKKWVSSRYRYAGPAALIALTVVLALSPSGEDPLYELFCVAVVFPIILFLGANAQETTTERALGDWLGGLSYPLYLVHSPVVRVFVYANEKMNFVGARLLMLIIADIVVIFVVAMISWKTFDIPTQRILKTKSSARPGLAA